MWTDPIVEETRRIRDEHARQFNYDLAAIFADIKRFEASLPGASFALNEGEEKTATKKEDLRALRQAKSIEGHDPTVCVDTNIFLVPTIQRGNPS